jgi:hypothetical protein
MPNSMCYVDVYVDGARVLRTSRTSARPICRIEFYSMPRAGGVSAPIASRASRVSGPTALAALLR